MLQQDDPTALQRWYEAAVQHHHAGELPEAEGLYRKILAADSNHADALHLLGVIAHQVGRNDIAADYIGRAIGIDGMRAHYHSNLGNALKQLGCLDDACAAYHAAIRCKPDFSEAHYNLGNTLKESGRLHDAVAAYRTALTLRPDYNDAHTNLGTVLKQLGKFRDGFSHCLWSLRIKETKESKSLFAEFLVGGGSSQIRYDLSDFALRALSESWAKPGALAPAIIQMIKRSLAPSNLLSPAIFRAFWSGEWNEKALARLAEERLLISFLRLAPISDGSLEQVLTACRRMFLATVTSDGAARDFPEPLLNFFSALGAQCFINEYVFDCSDEEMEKVRRISEEIPLWFDNIESINLPKIIAISCYMPLFSIKYAKKLLNIVHGEAVLFLLDLQISEPLRERIIRSGIRKLTDIQPGTSELVREHYEDNPYPRWMKTSPPVPKMSIEAYVSDHFPGISILPLNRPTSDILVAGCGTGQHPIEIAMTFPKARVLAIDLSLSSLSYAIRKTQEFGITNLEFFQADILKLREINRQFDVIESVGVLHHLDNPEVGLEILVSLLRPGGFLRLGLYSEQARQNVVAARAFIAGRGYRPTPEDIRRCRRDLLALDDKDICKSVVMWRDFASTSECRDLLFHVQEHRHSLKEVKRWLSRFGLAFLGFHVKQEVLRLFRARFPGPRSEIDLDLWDIFEQENPAAFAEMYQFWVQKADDPRR